MNFVFVFFVVFNSANRKKKLFSSTSKCLKDGYKKVRRDYSVSPFLERVGSPSLFVLNTSLRTNHLTSVQTLGGHEASGDTSLRNNFNCDVTCSCLNVQNNGEGGDYCVKYAFFHCVVFFSLLFTFGVESGKLGGLEGRSGWEGRGLLNSKCHNARTSSIYCFRDCLLYLVRVSF